MKVRGHGLSVGIERTENDFFLSIRAYGKLTHQDYEKITPVIVSALKGVVDPKIDVFCVTLEKHARQTESMPARVFQRAPSSHATFRLLATISVRKPG